jgi:phospholipase/carboxylesterase
VSSSGLAEWPHIYRDGDGGEVGADGPDVGPDVGPVLLMLHGTGSNEHDIASLGAAIDPSAAILAPRGRVSENGAARWFRRFGEGQFDVDDVIFRAGELAEFVAWAREEYALGMRQLVAVGFSNGANIALALALTHPEAVSRAIAFSGMYPLGDRETDSDVTGSSVLLLNGRADPMAPSTSVDRLDAQLRLKGATVERVTRDGSHGITEGEIAAAREWIGALGAE